MYGSCQQQTIKRVTNLKDQNHGITPIQKVFWCENVKEKQSHCNCTTYRSNQHTSDCSKEDNSWTNESQRSSTQIAEHSNEKQIQSDVSIGRNRCHIREESRLENGTEHCDEQSHSVSQVLFKNLLDVDG